MKKDKKRNHAKRQQVSSLCNNENKETLDGEIRGLRMGIRGSGKWRGMERLRERKVSL